jgi:diacylglycerol kinase (ATP)
MRIAPEASFCDGQLDVVCVGNIGRAALAGVFSKIYDGSHVRHPLVRCARGRRVEVHPLRPGPPLLVDADGQTPGYAPLTAELHPGALSLVS